MDLNEKRKDIGRGDRSEDKKEEYSIRYNNTNTKPKQNSNTKSLIPSKHKLEPDTHQTYTPQPSTPLVCAGSDYSWMRMIGI